MENFELRRVRDFGEIINATFEFLKQNFSKLYRIILLIAGPVFGLMLLALAFIGQDVFKLLTGGTNNLLQGEEGFDFKRMLVMLAPVALLWIVCLALTAVIVYQYICQYLENGYDSISTESIWAEVKANLLSYFLNFMFVGLLVIIGMVLLIIPGIYLAIALTPFFTVMAVERKTFVEAAKRCLHLTSGYWWFTFGVLLVIGILQSLASYIVKGPLMILQGIIDYNSAADMKSINGILMVLSGILDFFVGFLTYPISMLSSSLIYFSLVERKEGRGLFKKIESIGGTNPNEEIKEDY